MFRTRTAVVTTTALLSVAAPGALVASAVEGGGASAAMTPSVVAPGGSFTLIVDCSAVASPAPRVTDGQGLAAPLVLAPAGAGRYQATGRLASGLTGAVAVVVEGDCGSPASRWIGSVLVAGPTTPAPVRTPRPATSVPAPPDRTPGATTSPPTSAAPSAGGVRGGLGGALDGRPTRTEAVLGAGLLAVGALGAGVALARRARAGGRRH
ncbi:hypothetical protein [Streptomyces sp. NPDC049906]|uniref:hypothetical protein n=1 Tax=Streptomyces sp. NPDC049906 TaxID=3155656 RepID=UPI003425A441